MHTFALNAISVDVIRRVVIVVDVQHSSARGVVQAKVQAVRGEERLHGALHEFPQANGLVVAFE